ncbi:MAG: tRNA (adenosine(37)-N6)-threonylcarbamoyltransferase complex transferase subunit TsaD [Patescibacteria group bacterium]
MITNKQNFNILGIETSCDETGVAIVAGRGGFETRPSGRDDRHGRPDNIGIKILSEKLSSSVDLQREYGGVVPELASRVHVERINILIKEAMVEAKLDWSQLDGIAVANGPGLVGALLVGTMTAKTMAMMTGKPLISVNHLEGHIYSAFIERLQIGDNGRGTQQRARTDNIQFPILVLIVSGGHTELVLMNDWGDYQMIGSTIDDAAGEAFDKAAKILGLPYPGGPSISREAEEYNVGAGFKPARPKLPRPMIDSGDYNFSFSGLKTALLYKIRDMAGADISQLADEFQEAVVDVLVAKTARAYREFKVKNVTVVGGVAANKRLRGRMEEVFGDKLIVPPIKYCTDNGLKISVAGMFKYFKSDFVSWQELGVRGNWEL